MLTPEQERQAREAYVEWGRNWCANHETVPSPRDAYLAAHAQQQERIDAVTRERDQYRDTLLDRHGGEPLALLSELDEARQRIAELTEIINARDAEIVRLHDGQPTGATIRCARCGASETVTFSYARAALKETP